jgi:serine protease Do
VVPLTPQIGAQLGLENGTQGLVITDVDANSDAGAKGLTPGTVILAANGRSVATVADLESVIDAAKAGGREAVLLRVRPRNGPPAPVLVPIRLR